MVAGTSAEIDLNHFAPGDCGPEPSENTGNSLHFLSVIWVVACEIIYNASARLNARMDSPPQPSRISVFSDAGALRPDPSLSSFWISLRSSFSSELPLLFAFV